MAAIGEIVARSWQHTFSGLVSHEFLASMSADHQAARHTRTFSKTGVIYRVATVPGSGIAGFASGGPSRQARFLEKAELYAIYLRPGYERRGIGRALFETVATNLRQSSNGFYLTALAVSPNLKSYQSMGGREVNAPDIQLGSEIYPQIGFVWDGSPRDR